MWIICAERDSEFGPDYWQQDFGWTEFRANATRYSEKDKLRVRLPMNAYWEEDKP